MKATELSAGDIVLIGGRPTRIDAVHLRKVGWHSRKDRLTWTRIGLVQPMPVTAELLEQNGFKVREGCTTAWDWDSGETGVYISGDHTCPVGQTLTIYVPGCAVGAAFSSYRAISDMRIRGVHELQRAMRLCRISKEIIIRED